MKKVRGSEGGFTIVEMVTALAIFSIIALSMLGLYTSLVATAVLMKQKSIALTIASGQMEYVKSLPFVNVAIAGGSFYAPNPIQGTVTKSVNGVNYTVVTAVNYVDDAFDGCGSYPDVTTKNRLCRNQPAPSSAPALDKNPQDYKTVNIKVYGRTGTKLAEADTQITAKVAETDSINGALFVRILDGEGNPVEGANANVTNGTLVPAINLNDVTDSFGLAVFYGLPPDTGYDYKLTATKSGYSSLFTLPQGTLSATYPNVQVLSQNSSYATLVIKPQGANSVLLESTDTSGAALPGMKVYAKGGYKKYTATTDGSYYYDNMTPSDTRPTTDAAGLNVISNLAPGGYIFCGDNGAANCVKNGTTYYLTAAVPYGGNNWVSPVTIPTQSNSGDPGTSFTYNGSSYLQKVRLMFSTNANHPRVKSISPSGVSAASATLNTFTFQIAGVNLPCDTVAANCATQVQLVGATTYTATCTGSAAGTALSCTANLTGVTPGLLPLKVIANGQTLSLPGTPLLGGVNVTN